jgi:hypothetical protein
MRTGCCTVLEVAKSHVLYILDGVRDLCHMPLGVTYNTCVLHCDCHSEHVSYFRQLHRYFSLTI